MPVLQRRSFLQLAAASLPFSRLYQSVGPTGKPVGVSPVAQGEDRYAFQRKLPNGTTTFKVSSKDCSSQFFAMEHHHLSRGGPPRHLHHGEDEWFYVLQGEYAIEVGGTRYQLKAGDSILGPRGIPHAFAYVGDSSGRLLITYAPAGRMEEFFDTRDKQPGGRTSYVNDAAKMHAFGMELTGPPLELS